MMTLARRFILACSLALLAAAQAAAQDAPLVPAPFDGTEAFGHILHACGLEPVAAPHEASKLPPEQTLVVVFGDLEAFDKAHAGFLASFRAQGGALLLAGDFPGQIDLRIERIFISGAPVLATNESIYQEKWQGCPVIGPRGRAEPAHPICQGLTRGLATNRPSFLLLGGALVQPVASFAEDCRYVDAAGEHQLPENAAFIAASTAVRDGGRIVIVAGQGVFLNSMLMQKDNDNFIFTWNTIRWLAEGPRGPRQFALFVSQGKPVINFALPLTRLGPVPVPPIRVVNHMIRALEDENVFNRFLLSHGGKGPYLRMLLVLASLAVLIGGAWRIMNARFRLDTRVPLLVGKQQVAAPALPTPWLRQEELRQLGNYWEPAQILARQFFLDHAGLSVPLWDAQSPPPRLESSASFWQRRKLTRQVHQLWNLAGSAPANGVSARQFEKLLRLLADAAAGLHAQHARFVVADSVAQARSASEGIPC